ncbi:hypothetical protein QBC36DRAFT_128603 [Triangularia setosa]|uniref:Uncharacterized protein n=1 Tax=Triangularia setosa TaxID=2587417 RepID=A0AAN6W9M9_9PEZI|nr:hypothetical protein QBC36DRAFT_128603 [Podospora setosa]
MTLLINQSILISSISVIYSPTITPLLYQNPDTLFLQSHPAMSYSREDYYRTIVCAECGHSCKFSCLDAHKSSFACHNSDCANHLGKAEVDLPEGVLFSRKNSRKKSSRHESSSHRRSRSSARNSEESSSRNRSRYRTTHYYEYVMPQEEPSFYHHSRSSTRHQEPTSHHRSRSSARHADEPSSHHRSRSSARYAEEPSSHHRNRSSTRYPEGPRRSSGYDPQGHPSSCHCSYDGTTDYVTVEPGDTEHLRDRFERKTNNTEDLRQRFERMGRDERPGYPPSSSSYQYPTSSSHYQYPPPSSSYQYPPPSSFHSRYPPSASDHRSQSSTRHHDEPCHHRSRSHRGPVYEEIEIVDAGSSPYVAPSSERGRQHPPRSGRKYAYGPYDEPPLTPDLPPAPYIFVGTRDSEDNKID